MLVPLEANALYSSNLFIHFVNECALKEWLQFILDTVQLQDRSGVYK